MDHAVITVRRDPDYLHRSLLSLFTAGEREGPVHVFVGSPDASYVDTLVDNPRIVLHVLGEVEWRAIEGWEIRRRLSYNYSRCLDYFAGSSRGLCLCDDDVLYTRGFGRRLSETVDEIEATHREYILALYSTIDFREHRDLDRCVRYSSYPARQFFGFQGMYYPPTVLPDVAARMRADGVDDSKNPADLVVRDFCIERQYLYGTRRSLVQPLGRSSTGVGTVNHESPSFGGPEE